MISAHPLRRPAAQPGADARCCSLILVVLALAPFLFGGAQAINTAAKICVFIVLVASYDLLLGYTGIVSFAHTMFYGLGGYGVGLALYGWGATWTSALAGPRHRAGRRHRAGAS